MSNRTGLRVLMVEHDGEDASRLARALRDTPIPPEHVSWVPDLDSAREALEYGQPDLIVVDSMVPDATPGESFENQVGGRTPLLVLGADLAALVQRFVARAWRSSESVYACSSCGVIGPDASVVEVFGAPFCASCLEHGRDIDERYDDLGVGD